MAHSKRYELTGSTVRSLTEIQGCLSASAAVMRLDGLMVSILLMRSLASGVTVSHSGEGNYRGEGRRHREEGRRGGRRIRS